MKNIIITVFCFTTATSVLAEDEWLEKCGLLANMSEIIMTGRQEGVPMEKYIESSRDFSELYEINKKLVIDAYEISRQSSKAMKKKTIEEYRDKTYLACLKFPKDK